MRVEDLFGGTRTMRKAIHLTSVMGSDDEEHPLALCDDGTIWFLSFDKGEWEQLPDIPQPETEQQDAQQGQAG